MCFKSDRVYRRSKFVCIIQARIASSRLLGKILLPGHNKSFLEHLVERLKKSKQIQTYENKITEFDTKQNQFISEINSLPYTFEH